MEIKSFGNKETENFVNTGRLKKGCKWGSLQNIALRKIDMIIFADNINDLRTPPGNHLEVLAGDLKSFWSIRINNQFRIIFRNEGPNIYDLEILDYH